jgi:hypothetical protein
MAAKETALVGSAERDWPHGALVNGAESYGRDVVKCIGAALEASDLGSVFLADDCAIVRLYTRIAVRFARRAIGERS